MKSYRYTVGLMLVAAFVLASCTSIIDPEINRDPNQLVEVSNPALLLAPAQIGMSYAFGGDAVRLSGILVQYFVGADRQFLAIQNNYQLTEADVGQTGAGGFWQNIYTEALMNMELMRQRAVVLGNAQNYVGVSQVLRAATLGMTTDLFGDVPYTDALRGANALRATYDSQQDIYRIIQSLLDSALTNLASPSAVRPGNDDVMYGGDIARWRRAASALKARYALRLTKINANTAATQALAALRANPMQGNADDFQLAYNVAANQTNPMNAFQFQRQNMIDTNPSFSARLARLNDPRRSRLFVTHTNPQAYHVQAAAPSIVLSFSELKFIEAEALLRTNQTAPAQEAYRAAVAANFVKLGLTQAQADTYLQQADVSAENLTLEKILTQKYIALFMNMEGYCEWRRTGIPALRPNIGNAIPRRFPYSASERLYNNDNRTAAMQRQGITTEGDIFTPVWWDGGR